jgi:two-component system OmpR family sensor kinase
MALATRLALLVAAAVAALVVAGGGLFVGQLRTGLDASLDAMLRARADTVVQAVGPDGDTGFQDSGPSGVLPPDEALAQVVDSGGRLVESSHGAGGHVLLTAGELDRARTGPLTVDSGHGVRLLAVPVPGSGTPPAVVVVGTSTDLRDAAVERVRTQLVVAGALAVGFGGAGAWLLAGAVLRPVERMRRQAAEISASDSTARLPVPATRDEVARLGVTVNALLGRLQDALARQRDFVADAGHELRTPLTILRAELELADHPARGRADLRAAVGRAAEETDRLIRLAEDLLVLARADGGGVFLRREAVALDELVADAVRAAEGRAREAGVRVAVVTQGPVVVDGDETRLRQVLDNLLDNSVRFAPTGTAVVVRLGAAGETAVVQVLDEGPGFPEAFLPHAFERFRRADPARSAADGGAGLGLAIVASLVAAHGGAVSVANRRTGGACVRVELPVAPAAAPRRRRSV